MIVHLPVRPVLRLGAAGLVATAALTACGGSDPTTVAGSQPSTDPVPAHEGGAGRDFDPARMQHIRECLTAAGIAMPTPSGGFRTFHPSERPTWNGTDGPSGEPSHRRRGGAGPGMFADPKVRAALEACGIPVPTHRPTGAAGVHDSAPTTLPG
jgi:hypothetical protein